MPRPTPLQPHLNHLLSLEGFDLSGSALSVAVAVAQFAVVAVAPAEDLAALRQSHGVTVAAARRHQLSDHKPWWMSPRQTGESQ